MRVDLKARMATLIYEDGQRPMKTAARIADMLIKELMHEEHGRLRVKRYVTDWYIDDDTV